MTEPLAPEQLERLLPALGHLAEMVKKAGSLDRDKLELLAIGIGLEDDWAVDELERWTKVLARAREVSDAVEREMAQRALMLRGVPEAAAILAISVAASVGREGPPSPPQHLTVSVARLDLGTLTPGQGATAEFEVQGGPGQIVAESDQVQVTPQRFEAGTTRVRVEVRPMQSGVLWSTLRLVTARETLEVPLMAQWVESAISTPGPPGTLVTLVVAPDGSGDFRSLEEAVQQALPGTVLYLKAGVHRLSRPLQLDKPLSFIGAGMDDTRIVCDGEGHVVRFAGEGTFGASDLTFEHQGSQWARVVEVAGGEIHFLRCRFTGGVWDEQEQRGGSGLRLLGETSGTVVGCEFIRNGLHGILVDEQAQPTLEGNTCQGNKRCGIAYFGSAAGAARNNTCSDNEKHGIYVGEQAQPTLEGNTCQGNKRIGILFGGTTQGIARRNLCTGNEWDGIQVWKQAQPVVEANTCQGNKHSGIAYFGSAAGAARNNTCSGNEKHGIYVGEQAQPTLEGNTCQGNKQDGISYRNNAGGIARGNECADNGEDGIYVPSTARPVLKENRCRGNKGKDVNDLRH